MRGREKAGERTRYAPPLRLNNVKEQPDKNIIGIMQRYSQRDIQTDREKEILKDWYRARHTKTNPVKNHQDAGTESYNQTKLTNRQGEGL